MNTIVNERRLDFWDILGAGWRIFVFKFKDFSLLALALIVPNSILFYFLFQPLSVRPEITALRFSLLFLLLAFNMIVGTLAALSIAVITEKVVQRRNISAAGAIRHAFSRLGRALVTSFLMYIILAGLLLLFIIPGVIYSIYYAFALYAVVLREKSAGEALNYSKTLVQGQWWRVFGILAGLAMISASIDWIIGLPLRGVHNLAYSTILSNTILYFLSTILGVTQVVLFLNNDFVYHRRLARRAQAARAKKTRKAPSFEQALAKNKTRSTRKTRAGQAARKPAKKSKTAASRNTGG